MQTLGFPMRARSSVWHASATMPTPNDTWDTMKIALAQMCDDLAVATTQAKTLRRTLEEQPPKEIARAAKPRDGTSYLQQVLRACDALDELCSAYREVG